MQENSKEQIWVTEFCNIINYLHRFIDTLFITRNWTTKNAEVWTTEIWKCVVIADMSKFE